EVAVDVQHVSRARAPVQAVDVLRQRPYGFEVVLHLRDDLVPPVRDRLPRGALDFQEVLPGDLRPGGHHGSGEYLFHGQAETGRTPIRVDPADTAIGG